MRTTIMNLPGRKPPSSVLKEAGVALGYSKRGKKEVIYYNKGDTHTLCVGATRSGKSRSVVLQSIGLMGLAGESIVAADPKGELHAYTAPFLKRLGYEVIVLDFKDPLKSHRFNFLQRIIELVRENNIPRAVEATWDMTTMLVGEQKTGERIWHDGEAAIIASSILAVVCENMGNHTVQNLTNVYSFIAEMCRPINGELPINQYIHTLPETHPARALMGIAEVAPQRTRGSFFTGALTTLRLFTSPLIYDMTCESGFSLPETGSKRQAIFIILPDDRTTYYPLAALFISQLYESLVDVADKRGGRLERKVNFLLDEFGNLVPIPGMTAKLTACGSRGIRFNLFLQSLTQLDEKYGREAAQTILGNCETWIYLQADDPNTLDAISKKLGNYTVGTVSQSSSYNTANMGSGNSSQSTNLTSRALLTPDEVRLISRPYSLVTSRNHPAMLRAPDLSKWHFNAMFGLGDPEHNRKVREERDARRPSRKSENVAVKLWGIWNQYAQPAVSPGTLTHNPYITKANMLKERMDEE